MKVALRLCPMTSPLSHPAVKVQKNFAVSSTDLESSPCYWLVLDPDIFGVGGRRWMLLIKTHCGYDDRHANRE